MKNRIVVAMVEAKERLAEQYGLNSPPPLSPDWSGIDVGISNPVEFFIMICKFFVSPFVFVIREML